MEDFGKRLQELRQDKCYSQTLLAEKFNVSVDTVRHWEHGKRVPHITVIINLAKYFNVTVGQLVGTEEL